MEHINGRKVYFKSLRKQRNGLQLSVDEVAKKCKVSRQTVYNWEQGKMKPTSKHLGGLSEILEIEVGVLVAYFSKE